MIDLTETVLMAMIAAEGEWLSQKDDALAGLREEPENSLPRTKARAASLETLRQIREPGEGVKNTGGKHFAVCTSSPEKNRGKIDGLAAAGIYGAMIDHLIVEIGDD